MKTLLFLALLVQGCGLVLGPLRLLGVDTGRIMVHKDQPPKETLTAEEKEMWKQRFHEDYAECMREGSQYQTYSAGWGVSQYGGGGGASSKINMPLVTSCMEAKGYRDSGLGVSVFGQRLK